jgi:hypothetical protein
MPPDDRPRFDAADLRRFFTAVDAHLAKPGKITVIGGSAIARYGVPSGTVDIDTWETQLAPLERAITQARAATGLDIPVVPPAVADAPWDFQERLQAESGPWNHLAVLKLEPHDLALSKAVRGLENDFAAIEALHRIIPLDLATLVARHLGEMTHAVGDPVRRDLKFTLMIERLFGETDAERVERRLRTHRRRPTKSALRRKTREARRRA